MTAGACVDGSGVIMTDMTGTHVIRKWGYIQQVSAVLVADPPVFEHAMQRALEKWREGCEQAGGVVIDEPARPEGIKIWFVQTGDPEHPTMAVRDGDWNSATMIPTDRRDKPDCYEYHFFGTYYLPDDHR